VEFKAVARPDRDNSGFVTLVQDNRDVIVKVWSLIWSSAFRIRGRDSHLGFVHTNLPSEVVS